MFIFVPISYLHGKVPVVHEKYYEYVGLCEKIHFIFIPGMFFFSIFL